MTLSNYDPGIALFNWLTAGGSAASVRSLVYKGAAGIFQAADLRPAQFRTLYEERLEDEEKAKVLCLSIHDLGDMPDGHETIHQLGICIWDIQNGQDAMRAVREQLKYHMADLDDEGVALVNVVTAKQQLLTYHYGGRTGYRQSVYYQAEYDMLTYHSSTFRSDD